MSDYCAIKRLDGCPAIFLRFAGPDYVVIEVNRMERIVRKDFWTSLLSRDKNPAGEPTVISPGQF
jgi:hypothetical protein